jgi:hypothetical protein
MSTLTHHSPVPITNIFSCAFLVKFADFALQLAPYSRWKMVIVVQR